MKTINQFNLLLFICFISSCSMSKDMAYEDDIYSSDNGIIFSDNLEESNENDDYYDSESLYFDDYYVAINSNKFYASTCE